MLTWAARLGGDTWCDTAANCEGEVCGAAAGFEAGYQP